MSFIQREYDRLHEICTSNPLDSEIHQQAYMAKQALAWVMDPDCFGSPTKVINRWRNVDAGTVGTGLKAGGGALPAPLPS